MLESNQAVKGGVNSNLYIFAGYRKIWVPSGYSTPIPVAELPSEGRKVKGLTQKQVLKLAIQEFDLSRFGKKPFSL